MPASCGAKGGLGLRAIVLAAGEGRRMLPLTATRPKALLEFAGGTLIDHIARALKDAGADSIAVVVGHMADPLVAHLEKSRLGPFDIVRQEKPLGTGDALRAAARLIDGDTLVVNGDVLLDRADLAAVAEADARWAAVTMLTAEVADPSRYGVVETEAVGKGPAKVKALVEKPEQPVGQRVNAGVYRVSHEIVGHLEKLEQSVRGEYELTSAIGELVKDGRVAAVAARHPWTEVGRPWDLLAAQERLFAKLKPHVEGELEHGAVLKDAVVIAKGALVKSGAYIEGPVYIGPDCRIGPNCYIRPSTHIGEGCHIGAATEVKNSVVFAGSNAPHQNYVGDSIIGSQVNLGAGTKIANLRLDEREVFVNLDGARTPTGRRKFGAVIADGVKTGINASIDVGTVIGPGAFIGPGARASGAIEAGARVM